MTYFGKRPVFWYAFVIWFDFFPWSVLLPTGLLVLWKQKPLQYYPREGFLLVWVLGYFLAFTLLPEKHERYLMPLVPGVAVLIGYLYHRMFETKDLEVWTFPLFKGMLGLLSVLCIVAVFLAPYLIHKKWNVSTDIFPLLYQLTMVCGSGVLLYALLKVREKVALTMVGVLAVGIMIGVVIYIVPGINAIASPKLMMTEVQAQLKNPNDPIRTFQHWNWRNDEDLYYWQHVHKHQSMIGGGDLTDKDALNALRNEVEKTWTVDHFDDRTAILSGSASCVWTDLDSVEGVSATEEENSVGLDRVQPIILFLFLIVQPVQPNQRQSALRSTPQRSFKFFLSFFGMIQCDIYLSQQFMSGFDWNRGTHSRRTSYLRGQQLLATRLGPSGVEIREGGSRPQALLPY